jgi:hypothetical protein
MRTRHLRSLYDAPCPTFPSLSSTLLLPARLCEPTRSPRTFVQYPRFTGRRDRRGIPIYVYQVRHLDSSTVAKYEKSADTTYSQAKTDGKTPGKLLRLFALYENLTRFVQPLSTECTDRDHASTPITLSTNIVDISQVSLRQFWNLKGHMQAASQLATSHYPETLDRASLPAKTT